VPGPHVPRDYKSSLSGPDAVRVIRTFLQTAQNLTQDHERDRRTLLENNRARFAVIRTSKRMMRTRAVEVNVFTRLSIII
jgi:hypothetical protein